MPPRPQVTKEQVIEAALGIAREKGLDKVTAREVGKALGMSSRPVFTYYSGMEELKADVYKSAYDKYAAFVEAGREGPRVFRSFGQQTIRFVKENPELFRLLCLPYPGDTDASSVGSFKFFEKNFEYTKDIIKSEFGFDDDAAHSFFRNLWLFTLGAAMLILSGSCPYTDDELQRIMSEVSFSTYKLYKDYPGLSTGDTDINQAFAMSFGHPTLHKE